MYLLFRSQQRTQNQCAWLCRFSYCALSCCSLLGNLHAIDVSRAVSYVVSCQNFDGGFGNTPGGF